MRGWMPLAAAGSLAVGLASVAPAEAATITRTFEVTGSGFSDAFGVVSPAPIDPVLLRFTVTCDPTILDTPGSTTGITLLSSNLPLGSAIGWLVNLSGRLNVGGVGGGTSPTIASGIGTVGLGTDDWNVTIDDPESATPLITLFAYSTAGTPRSVFSRPQSQSVTIVEVPEPSTLALLGLGLAGLAGLDRRRKAA